AGRQARQRRLVGPDVVNELTPGRLARKRRRGAALPTQLAQLGVRRRPHVERQVDADLVLFPEPPGALAGLIVHEEVHGQLVPDDGIDDRLQVEPLVDALIGDDYHAMALLFDRVDDGLLAILALYPLGQRPGV